MRLGWEARDEEDLRRCNLGRIYASIQTRSFMTLVSQNNAFSRPLRSLPIALGLFVERGQGNLNAAASYFLSIDVSKFPAIYRYMIHQQPEAITVNQARC